jgi:hypothetical protein
MISFSISSVAAINGKPETNWLLLAINAIAITAVGCARCPDRTFGNAGRFFWMRQSIWIAALLFILIQLALRHLATIKNIVLYILG